MTEDGTIHVSVNVSNSGIYDGAEVVQLYISDPECSVERPAKELKGFETVFIKVGETTTVGFDIKAEDLSYFDAAAHKWVAEKGEFKVLIGSASDDIRATLSFRLQ